MAKRTVHQLKKWHNWQCT